MGVPARPSRETRVAEIVAGLRHLADQFESGDRKVLFRGQAARRVAGVLVVPVVMHHAVCGWRIMTEQEDTDPAVAVCAGCGLGVLLAEVEGWPTVL